MVSVKGHDIEELKPRLRNFIQNVSYTSANALLVKLLQHGLISCSTNKLTMKPISRSRRLFTALARKVSSQVAVEVRGGEEAITTPVCY